MCFHIYLALHKDAITESMRDWSNCLLREYNDVVYEGGHSACGSHPEKRVPMWIMFAVLMPMYAQSFLILFVFAPWGKNRYVWKQLYGVVVNRTASIHPSDNADSDPVHGQNGPRGLHPSRVRRLAEQVIARFGALASGSVSGNSSLNLFSTRAIEPEAAAQEPQEQQQQRQVEQERRQQIERLVQQHRRVLLEEEDAQEEESEEEEGEHGHSRYQLVRGQDGGML